MENMMEDEDGDSIIMQVDISEDPVYPFLMNIFYRKSYRPYREKLITEMIKNNKQGTDLLYHIFEVISFPSYYDDDGTRVLKINIFKLLLDSGLPVDAYIPDYMYTTSDSDLLTPLHLSIYRNEIDFVSKHTNYSKSKIRIIFFFSFQS